MAGLSAPALPRLFGLLLKLYLGILRQDPFFHRPTLSKCGQFALPNLAEQNDALVGAAQVLLATIGDWSLADLRDKVLGVHQRDLVVKKFVQISEIEFTRQDRFAHLRHRNFCLLTSGVAGLIILCGFAAQR